MDSSKLVQVLRTVIGSADSKGTPVFLHFTKPTSEAMRQGAKNLDFNALMQNVGSEQFSFESFKSVYDTDPRVKALVKNFDKTGVEPKTQTEIEGPATPEPEGNADTVNTMAKRAVDLKDL